MKSDLGAERTFAVRELPLAGSRAQKPLRRASILKQIAIIDAAVDLFYDAGYSATSMDDVARTAGIPKGSLYHYIDSKEDLLFRIVQQTREDTDRIFAGVELRRDQSALERLGEFIRQLTLYKARNERVYTVTRQDGERLTGTRRDVAIAWRTKQEQFQETLIREAMANGELPTGIDPKVLTYCSRSLTIEVYRYASSEGTSPEELAAFAARFVIAAIRGTCGAERAAPPPPSDPSLRRRRKRRTGSQPGPGVLRIVADDI